MEDEGYNVEWSQELKLEESVREYAKAWVLIAVLRRLFGWEAVRDGTIFNMSVGYNLEGILTPRMQKFIDTMLDAGELIAEYRAELALYFPEFADVAVPDRMTNSCTLSTMHGCPPDEIGRIAKYLLDDRGFNLAVKLNPTLMGPDFVRGTLKDRLGYENIEIKDAVFDHDLKYPQAIDIIRTMNGISAKKGLFFGVKLSNTLAMSNRRSVMPGDEMYMSGRSLYPVTMNLWNKLNKDLKGDLNVSYSAGADALNVSDILSCGARTVTIASDILKPGGYPRFVQCLRNLESAMRGRASRDLAEFAASRDKNLEEAAHASLADARYTKRYFRGTPKVSSPLGIFDCVEAPCVAQCAVRQDVPAYALAISRGDYATALEIILSRNPLPGVTGHVCTRLCESKCTRANYDEPVGIRALKRFAVEQGVASARASGCSTGHRVAIIGAGPSGLAAAASLALSGVGVTMYEARGRAGGMMAIAPSFRLPKEVMDSDVERIKSLGVEIKLNTKVTKPPESLLRDGFDAVYVACGFPKDTPLGIEGDDTPGVWTALDLLERVSVGEAPDLGKKILVVGGGNTAMDAARTARRVSAGHVTVVYRRTREEMPAEDDEKLLLFEEGSELVELAAPKRVIVKGGRVAGLECERTRLGAPQADGRRRPEPTGELFIIEGDSIVAAIGQSSDMAIFSGTKVHVRKNGAIDALRNGRTNMCGIYAGGDAVTGPAIVIAACADGRRAAEAICSELCVPLHGGALSIQPAGDELARVREARANKTEPEHEARISLDRRSGFDLVEATFSEEAALREAKRCLQCSTVCNKCVEVCPNRANYSYAASPISVTLPRFAVRGDVLRSVGTETFTLAQGSQIVHIDDFCNECGNCGAFCVHEGRPYMDKPRLCLNEEDFVSQDENVFRVEGAKLRRRSGGREESLTVRPDGYSYESENAKIEMDRGFTVLSAHLEKIPDGEISLRSALEMSVLYNGVANSMSWLLETK
jgi:putative selenate reductase